MTQQDEPADYVFAPCETTEVREFVRWAFEDATIPADFEGTGMEEHGLCRKTDKGRVTAYRVAGRHRRRLPRVSR